MERVDAAAASRSAGATSTRSCPTRSTSGGCRTGKTYDGQHPAMVEQATWDGARPSSRRTLIAARAAACLAHLLMGRIQVVVVMP